MLGAGVMERGWAVSRAKVEGEVVGSGGSEG